MPSTPYQHLYFPIVHPCSSFSFPNQTVQISELCFFAEESHQDISEQILRDVTVDTGYVQPMNFLAPGSRDMFDTNNKVVDYLFRALCQPEFDRVHTEHLACRIWLVL
jgi:hypothetical protein